MQTIEALLRQLNFTHIDLAIHQLWQQRVTQLTKLALNRSLGVIQPMPLSQ